MSTQPTLLRTDYALHPSRGGAPAPLQLPDRRPEPRPSQRTLRRHRGGTYSATIEQIRFTDGSMARTDLIRLNPDVDAYSLDFEGSSPQGMATYRFERWASLLGSRASRYRAEIAWILAHSYPRVGLEHLTRLVRSFDRSLGPATIKPHQAIAATQAAIWHLTNGLDLDVTPLDQPRAVHLTRGGELLGRLNHIRPDFLELAAGESIALEAEMAEAVLLGGFRVWLGSATSAGVSVRLERSADGRAWARVPGSGNGQPGEVTVAGAQVLSRRLGVGATVDHAAKGALVGNRHYRIVLTAPSEAPARVELRDVSWSLSGSRRYRNSGAVVALYRYLLEGARTALNDGPGVPAAQLLRAPTLTRARADGSRIGPVRWMGPVPARVRVLGSAPAFIVDDAGERVEQLIPEQEYSLVIGPVAATGELSIQLSYELERPEALVLRGQSEARSGRMSPLVTVENSTLSHGFTQRLILVAEAR